VHTNRIELYLKTIITNSVKVNNVYLDINTILNSESIGYDQKAEKQLFNELEIQLQLYKHCRVFSEELSLVIKNY